MGIRTREYYIAVCDICDTEFEDGNGGTQGFYNNEDARNVVTGCGWIIKDGKLKCWDCHEQEKPLQSRGTTREG